MVDNELHKIASFDDSDRRHHLIRVAGPAALLVAKVIKIGDRSELRRQPKDGLDVLRLLQSQDTIPLATRLAELANDPIAGDVTRTAMTWLALSGQGVDGPLADLTAQTVAGLTDPTTITGSLVALVEDLASAYDSRTRG